jgi:predicted dehydrogenase
MEKVKIAVIGCSAIAKKTVIPTIISSACFDLKLVGSRTVEKGKQFADMFECDHGTYEDVLNNSDISAVYVSVPTGLHYSIAKQVLEAGKHLLLEKPFTDSLKSAQDLIDTAKLKGLIAMEVLPYVYHPYFKEVQELLKQNIIGKIKLIECSFGFPYLPLTDIRNKVEIGGGAILDNLIYPLSASMLIADQPIISKSYRLMLDKKLNIDESGFLRIDWNEFSANINYGFGFSYKNSIQIWGSEGTITVDRAFTKPADAITEIIIKKSNNVETVIIPATGQFDLMVQSFYNKITGLDQSGKNENGDILKRMAIISELYNSAKDILNE